MDNLTTVYRFMCRILLNYSFSERADFLLFIINRTIQSSLLAIAAQSDTEDGGSNDVVENVEIDFKPIIKLQAVILDSGEANEEVVFETFAHHDCIFVCS